MWRRIPSVQASAYLSNCSKGPGRSQRITTCRMSNESFMKSTALVLVSLMLLTACASTRVGRDAADINNASEIRGDEWNQFADDMVNAIQSSLPFQQAIANATPDNPVVLGMGDITIRSDNLKHVRRGADGQGKFQRGMLTMTQRFRAKLVNAYGGLVVVNMDITGDSADKSERSTLINNVREGARGSAEYNQSTAPGYGEMRAPAFSLERVVISNSIEEDGDVRYDYQLNLKLVDLRRGVGVWEEVLDLPKSFERGFFGG